MNPTTNSWLVRMPFLNVSHIRELMAQGTPIYGLPQRKNYSPDDFQYIPERKETENERFPSISDILNGHTNLNVPNVNNVDDQDAGFYVGLSGDSLAFTLVYVSVFTLTLLYVGVRLARRWRKKQRIVQHATLSNISIDESSSIQPSSSLPPCGHPQCARAVRSTNFLPYTWLPAVQPVHNTAVCRGRCEACRQLQQPPPSYTKLFLDDQPPAYADSIVIKNESVVNLEHSAESASENDNEIVYLEASNSDFSFNSSSNTDDPPVISNENEIIVEFNEFLGHEDEDLRNEDEETPLTNLEEKP